MTQHTPGPWEVDGPNTNLFVANMNSTDERSCDGIRQVCKVEQGSYELPDYQEAAANARLIAAAPQMLEALQLIRDTTPVTHMKGTTYSELLKAITAATNP